MDKINEFEKDLATYKKITETLYMIVIVNGEYVNSLTKAVLSPKILKNMEEVKVIPYRASVDRLIWIKNEYRDKLLEKYKDDREKRWAIHDVDFNDTYVKESDKEENYNLIKLGYGDLYSWWQSLLKSKLDINERSLIYVDVLSYDWHPETFIECTEINAKEESDAIFKHIDETPNLKNYIFNVLLKNNPSTMDFLQENGYVNFSYTKGDAFSTLMTLLKEYNTLTRGTIAIYNGLTDEDRQAMIPIILARCDMDLSMLKPALTKLDFKLSEKVIDLLSTIVRNNFAMIDSTYGLDGYRSEIAESIICKSHNKEEYKVNKKYAKEFLDRTDYQKELERQELANRKVSSKREELSTLLFNLNDKLQEEVPGKTKIKNIDFKTLS